MSYHEYRAPQGAPADGEHDVWLENGTVKWGHWSAATSAWVVDATADSAGLVGVQGPPGDPCPTGGEADTLDGKHASEFVSAGSVAWTDVTSYLNNWHVVGGGYASYRKKNGIVEVMCRQIACNYESDVDKVAFILPEGFRPGNYMALGISHSYGGPSGVKGYVVPFKVISNGYVYPNGWPGFPDGQPGYPLDAYICYAAS